MNYVLLLVTLVTAVLFSTQAWSAPAVPFIVSAIGLTGVAAAVASVVINVALSYIVSKALQPDRPQAPGSQRPADPGVRQRIRSDTSNKLPVVYGTQRMRGTIMYSAITSDNQRMGFNCSV